MLRKIIVWTGGAAVVLSICVVALLVFLNRRAASEERARAAQQRLDRKVRVHDEMHAVRMRLGLPDTTYSQTEYQTLWIYGDINAPDLVLRIQKASPSFVDAVFVPVEGTSKWVPEDELTPSKFEDAEEVSRRFSAVLGVPCDTAFSVDSTGYDLYFPLSEKELASDSAYSRMVTTGGGQVTVVRALSFDLTGGKKVIHHSWQQALGPRASACQRRTGRPPA